MSLAAAIDIGNATTEVLIARLDAGTVTPVWDARIPTRGRKGGEASLAAAAELLARGERETERRCEEIVLTRLRPVESLAATASAGRREDGPARSINAPAAQTPAGHGVGAGELISFERLAEARPGVDLVVYVPGEVDFEEAARGIQAALDRRLSVVAVLAAGDDAVLIHNRIDAAIPIVDEVEIEAPPFGVRAVVEVALPGRRLATLGDPIALTATLGLRASCSRLLRDLARAYVDRRAGAVLAVGPAQGGEKAEEIWAPWVEGPSLGRVRLGPGAAKRLSRLPVGSLVAAELDRDSGRLAISDAFAVDLGALDSGGWVRRGVLDDTAVPIALLRTEGEHDPKGRVQSLTDRPVSLVAEEPAAARVGALSTPAASPRAHVLDMGGGTIDLAGDGRLTAAGAGELLTIAVASALRVPRAVAEEIKRGPLVRVAGPRLIQLEDGERRYLESAVVPEVIGKLARLSAGTVTVADLRVSAEEWRGLRLVLKEAVLGANVERLLETLPEPPAELLTAGGAAEDEELVQILGERLRSRGIVVGRANVGGRFGPRHAVTYGLLLMLAAREEHVGTCF